MYDILSQDRHRTGAALELDITHVSQTPDFNILRNRSVLRVNYSANKAAGGRTLGGKGRGDVDSRRRDRDH